MTEYGIQPTGFSRKPLAVILAEFEQAFITEFGPDVIQTAQSPLGQLNGLMADIVTQLWEEAEDLYQSYDPDQAEGRRLDMLARLRLITRNGASDADFRRSLTNFGEGRVDIQNLVQALESLEGVTFVRVYVNETGEVTLDGLETGTIAVAIIGGNDVEIADTLRRYVVPGVNTYGNMRVTTNVAGFCRTMSIIRPIEVEVSVDVVVRLSADQQNCPAPSVAAIKTLLEETWLAERSNGTDPSFYSIRSIIERAYTNVEVVSVTGSRNGLSQSPNEPVEIGFIEIATLSAEIIVE